MSSFFRKERFTSSTGTDGLGDETGLGSIERRTNTVLVFILSWDFLTIKELILKIILFVGAFIGK